MDKGFTLIELLVVVLIIGILSSVALPQYQKAVDKARGTEAVMAAKTVTDSANLYFLENRHYPATLSELTIKVDTNLKNFNLVGTAESNTVYRVDITATKGSAVLTTRSTRGKLDSQTCTGADCSNFFSCKQSGTTCTFN